MQRVPPPLLQKGQRRSVSFFLRPLCTPTYFPSLHTFGSFIFFAIALDLFYSSRFHVPAIHARTHTHTCTRIGAKCSICKIAEYGRKTQAACMPIWRAVAATLFHSFPFLCESANTDGKIEILTLTLHPRNVHRIPTLCHCRCPPAISVFHSWKLALNYGEIRLGSLLLKLFTLRVFNYL